MSIVSRLRMASPSRSRLGRPATRSQPDPMTAPEERWWFPMGSITRVGEGAFQWHCVGYMPEDHRPFIFSGRLELYNSVGILHDEDADEGDVEEDPSESWYEKLPPFPYVHLFFDETQAEEHNELGPWFCMHGIYRFSRTELESACTGEEDSARGE